MDPIMWKDHGHSREDIAKMYLTEGTVSEFNAGGKLDPAQQLGLFNAMRAQSTLLAPFMGTSANVGPNGGMLPAVANPNPFIPNEAPTGLGPAPITTGGPGITFIADSSGRTSGKVESLISSGHVTTGATQGTRIPGPFNQTIKPRVLQWSYEKYHVGAEWAKETTWQTLLGNRFSPFLMSRIMPAMANDLELGALHGDMDNTGSSSTDEVLKINDGWLKQMRALSPSESYEGNFVDEAIFFDMIRSFPTLFQPYRKYWFCNPAIPVDWLQLMGARGAGALEASQYLAGRSPAPLGIQFWTVPQILTDEAVTTIAAATNARVIGGGSSDQFIFPVDAYQISLNINAAGAVVIAFPHDHATILQDRSLSIFRVCKIINDALVDEYASNTYRNVARPGQFGNLELVSPTTGAASNITIAAPASSALSYLGLTAGSYSGQAAAAGGTNTAYIGTSMFLTMPENLQWRTCTAPEGTGEGGFQQYVKYRQESDTIRYDAWAFHDFTLDCPEALVLRHGIRTARSGETPVPTP